jgi:hypothetical protein
MKQAVGTSLLIIAAKSLFGFLGDRLRTTTSTGCCWVLSLRWPLPGFSSATASAAISAAIKLQKAFGWFVLVDGYLYPGARIASSTRQPRAAIERRFFGRETAANFFRIVTTSHEFCLLAPILYFCIDSINNNQKYQIKINDSVS